jgi:hypothetical protein
VDDGLAPSSPIGWLLRPVALSREAALARMDVSLRAVSASDRRHVFVVGDGGLIARSTDGGRTWEQERIVVRGTAPQNQKQPAPAPTPVPSGPQNLDRGAPPGTEPSPPANDPERGKATGALLGWLVPPAMAAEPSQQGPPSKPQDPSAAPASLATDHLIGVNAGPPTQALTETGWLLRRQENGTWTPQSWAGDARETYLQRWRGGAPRGYFLLADKQRRWWATASGEVVPAIDGRTSTPVKVSRHPLHGVFFLPDGRHGWVIGDHGVVMATADGGARWTARTRLAEHRGWPLSAPAPWYYLALFALGYLVMRPRPPPPPDVEPGVSVADVMVSDKPLMPGEPDLLEFNVVARALSRFLRNENTRPPLTIGITGDWGTGKSSLMNLLRADLESFGFRPVWFNAWHLQGLEHLLASLLQSIRLQSVPSLSPEGLVFRTRLLARRAIRSWLRLMLLALLVSVFLTLEVHHDHDVVEALITGIPAALRGQRPSGAPEWPSVALLLSVLLTVGTLWRWLRAFGISPGNLLAQESQAARPRDLDAQTSFLDRFAGEYRDITAALGVRPLILFIDDLDRCQPEHVVEVLEAVNFLVSSGDCFVVLGMARDRIEPCVSLRFKEVADELTERNGPADDAERRQRRDQYARDYLDKLINVEVPVPRLTAEVAGRLFPSEDSAVPVRLRLRHDRPRVLRLIQGTGTLLLLATAIGLGIFTGNRLPDSGHPAGSATVPAAAPEPEGAAPGAPFTPRDAREPKILPGRSRIETIWVIAPLALLGIATGLLWHVLTSRRERLVVKDTAPFVRALEIWRPVVFRALKTPRGLKRFLNRVRYLAMRARSGDELLVSRWDRWFRPPMPAPRERPHIPEPVVVALAAIHALDAGGLPQVGVKAAPHTDPEVQELVEAAARLHERVFGDGWETLARHRDDFLERAAGIRVN